MASLDRVKVLVLGDSGERFNPPLGLPTLLSYPITLFLHYFSVPATIWLRPWLKALSRSKNYTSQRTLLYLTKVALRGSGARGPGLSPPSQLSRSVSLETAA